MSRINKLLQLFAEGTLVELEAADETILVWVAKLNPFEDEQANQAARVASARAQMAIKEVNNPEYDLFQSSIENLTDDSMRVGITDARSNNLFMEVIRDIRSDPEWHDRVELLELGDEPKDDVEREYMAKLNHEYSTELIKRHRERIEDLAHDLGMLQREDLVEQFRESYLEQRGFTIWSMERERQQIYLSMRECNAERDANGRWSHDACDHRKFFLDKIGEVDSLPEFVRKRITEAYAEIVVPPTLARFSDALESSSESPERSVSEEASAASSPEETSAEQDATS
jgi:hypothetical protein